MSSPAPPSKAEAKLRRPKVVIEVDASSASIDSDSHHDTDLPLYSSRSGGASTSYEISDASQGHEVLDKVLFVCGHGMSPSFPPLLRS